MGGIEVMARDQATSLAERGWDVTVFTSRLNGDPPSFRDGPLKVRRFKCLNTPETRAGVPVPLMAPTLLSALLREAATFDVILAHGHVYIGSWYASVAARTSHVPFVVVQSSPFVEYASPSLNRLERTVDGSLGRSVLERADQVVAISDFTRRYVEGIAPRAKVTRIYPGVDLSRFYPSETKVERDRPLFVTVRRLVPRNGVDVLVRTWVEWSLGRFADLAIAGDGPLRHRLAAIAGSDPSVTLLGRVPDEDLPEFYRGADAFVLPTVSGEGYGLALAEALASGLPVIATDDGAPSELVNPGTTGLLVPPGSTGALASAIRQLATDGKCRLRLAEDVREARLSFDREDSVDQLDRVLRGLVESDR